MTSEIIERVATAMRAESANKPFSWENAARAAIKAMREPTVEMCREGAKGGGVRSEWLLMIDAALK